MRARSDLARDCLFTFPKKETIRNKQGLNKNILGNQEKTANVDGGFTEQQKQDVLEHAKD